jgi:hypothetical protein
VDSENNSMALSRTYASRLLSQLGIRRIVIVDDEYSDQGSIEEFLGYCSELSPDLAVTILGLEDVPFEAGYDVWSTILRDMWASLELTDRSNLLQKAMELARRNEGGHEVAAPGDSFIAANLRRLLADLPDCGLVTLSLLMWRSNMEQYLDDSQVARDTLFLFDRDFSREGASANEGILLVSQVQARDVALCGLITHTVSRGQEQEEWESLARLHNLDRDRFLVIAKERLASESDLEHQSFLRMVRLAGLSSRCADLKNAAWKVFRESLEAAQDAVERVSVLDFDQIVLASSHREGVSELDTLFRVFSIFMRQEARSQLYKGTNDDIASKALRARTISIVPPEIASKFGSEPRRSEAIRVQRFELFESGEFLSAHHLPLDLGDIFEDKRGQRYVLLAQPCELMVRPNGMRDYEDTNPRYATLCEIVAKSEKPKPSWEEVILYDESTGDSGFVNFAVAHHFRLDILDLCVLSDDGRASIDVRAPAPGVLTQPWLARLEILRRRFESALVAFRRLEALKEKDEVKKLVLPSASLSRRFKVSVNKSTICYDLKRVGRLNQPRSGALLTKLSQFGSRAAFEHDLIPGVPARN